jgi:hypothetical protein
LAAKGGAATEQSIAVISAMNCPRVFHAFFAALRSAIRQFYLKSGAAPAIRPARHTKRNHASIKISTWGPCRPNPGYTPCGAMNSFGRLRNRRRFVLTRMSSTGYAGKAAGHLAHINEILREKMLADRRSRS